MLKSYCNISSELAKFIHGAKDGQMKGRNYYGQQPIILKSGKYYLMRKIMSKANGGESGQHMSWQQAWGFAKSQPYELQKETIYALNLEIYDFLAFATESTQLEVLEFAPDYVIDLFRDKKRKYTKIVDGNERVGYLQIIKPDVLEYLNEARHIKMEPKRKRKGCHSKHG